MKNSGRKRWLIPIAILALLAVVLAPFVAPGWSEINCSHEDIDLQTGRARLTRMLYWTEVRHEIAPTAISETLGFTDCESEEGDWHRVNTHSSRAGYSPHYAYHSSFYQIGRLAGIWDDRQYTQAARAASASRVLQIWREAGDDELVNEYLRALCDVKKEVVREEDIASLTLNAELRDGVKPASATEQGSGNGSPSPPLEGD